MDKRLQFDFEVDYKNGGGLVGQGFQFQMAGVSASAGDHVSDGSGDLELADAIVHELRRRSVDGGDIEAVRIVNKRVVALDPGPAAAMALDAVVYIDMSHTIENGLVTYKGLPAPVICDYLSREESRKRYAPGTEFQIGKIEMVTNTGTYIDVPFHRYAHGKDLSQVTLTAFVDLDGVVFRTDYRSGLAIDASVFQGHELQGRAVLVHTGWDAHWNTERYYTNHPFLTADAADYLQACGVKLVGIDSHNIDDTRTTTRPVHTTLLGADILIVEHLCHLGLVPDAGFTFTALPPKFKGVGTFPVRALAKVPWTSPIPGRKGALNH